MSHLNRHQPTPEGIEKRRTEEERSKRRRFAYLKSNGRTEDIQKEFPEGLIFTKTKGVVQ